MTDFSIGATQLDEFRTNGFVVLRSAIPRQRVTRVRDALARIICTMADRVGIAVAGDVDSDELIDTVLPKIYAANPRAGGFVFDTISSHSCLYALYHWPPILSASARLLGVEEAEMVENRPNFILQAPGDCRRINGWHQESPYMSDFFSPEKTVFAWIPMSNVTAECGAIWVVPGSHRDGMLPHHTNAIGGHMDRDWDENGEAFLKKSQFEVDKAIQIDGAIGDLVILDFNVVHKRGLNAGPTTRLTGIFRLGAFTGRDFLPKYGLPAIEAAE